MGHKPFLVLSDHLTRKGIVVLRADKRGVGNSGGSYSDAVMADFASDADAGVAFLKTRKEVDARKIGLVGHSEGAIEAPMSAAHNPDVAFIVMMAGPGVRGDRLLPEQLKLIELASGKSPEAVEKDLATQRVVMAILEGEKDDSVREKQLRESLKGQVPEEQIGMQIKAVNSPWFRGLLEYDPALTLSQIKCPVLVLNGEKDLQVPPQQNLPPIRHALESAGNPNFEVDELPGLNHLFQTAKTGAVSEYSDIEETISPVVLEKIASWILQQTKMESRPASVAEIQSRQGK
jgi:pimeloyl-ACP methyl ester carboxylesterase